MGIWFNIFLIQIWEQGSEYTYLDQYLHHTYFVLGTSGLPTNHGFSCELSKQMGGLTFSPTLLRILVRITVFQFQISVYICGIFLIIFYQLPLVFNLYSLISNLNGQLQFLHCLQIQVVGKCQYTQRNSNMPFITANVKNVFIFKPNLLHYCHSRICIKSSCNLCKATNTRS